MEKIEYQDPCPGQRGDDKVWKECGMCGGSGVYQGPSSWVWQRGNQVSAWCFYCGGSKGRYIKVSSVRAAERKRVRQHNQQVDEAPLREWLIAENRWQEKVDAEVAAYKEQARRDTLVTGFVGDIGQRVRDLVGEITVYTSYERAAYNSYNGGTEVCKFIVIRLSNGQVVKTSGNANSLFGWERGALVKVTGTVKSHDQYQGQDQTTLQRVKITAA